MITAATITRHPTAGIAALACAQILFWTLAPALTHSAPPLDVVEMLVWGREGVIATFKHPNLPGLMLDAARRLSQGAFWPVYAVSQICIAASLVAVYALGRSLFGPARGLAGALLLTGIFYYSWPTPEFNHNVAQMPFWAGVCLALWQATRSRRMHWWILLGACAGLAIWAKYSAVVLLAVALGWILWDGRARRCLASAGPWVAVAVFAAIVAPQAAFLIEAPLSPIDYALGRASSKRTGGPIGFLLAQVASHGVFFLGAAAAGLFGRGAARRPAAEADSRRFLAVMGLGPALLAALASAVAGLGLKDMWGMPMFGLSGLLLLAALPGRFDDRALRRLAIIAAGLLMLVPCAYAASVSWHGRFADKPSRVTWPQDRIASSLIDAYRQETGRVPQVIAGPVWEAGLVALAAPGAPSVLIDGDRRKAPWIGQEDIAQHGALAVWGSGKPPAVLRSLLADSPAQRYETPSSVSGKPIRLHWAVIPPRRP